MCTRGSSWTRCAGSRTTTGPTADCSRWRSGCDGLAGASLRQPDAPHVPADVAMRLATFNINGRSPGENRVDPDRLANSIRTLAPDILALQEVDLYQPRTTMPTSPRLSPKPWSKSTTDSSRPSPARQAQAGSRRRRGTNHRPGVRQRPVLPLPRPQLGSRCDAWGRPAPHPPASRPPTRCHHRRRTQSGADRRHRDTTWVVRVGEHSPVVPARLQSRSAEARDQMRGAGQAPGS